MTWRESAACAGADTELFYLPQPGGWHTSKRPTNPAVADYCSRCTVAADCLEEALDRGEHGVWGGHTDDERAAIRKRRRRAALKKEKNA